MPTHTITATLVDHVRSHHGSILHRKGDRVEVEVVVKPPTVAGRRPHVVIRSIAGRDARPLGIGILNRTAIAATARRELARVVDWMAIVMTDGAPTPVDFRAPLGADRRDLEHRALTIWRSLQDRPHGTPRVSSVSPVQPDPAAHHESLPATA